ncbi:NhaP-type Na+/H+ and K+/H+ antiporter [Mucilaginibacter sp. UYP25]
MKQIIAKFVVPLTIISFSIITMRSIAFVDDIGSIDFIGFPFLYTCKGFHTSMSQQFFLVPLLVDFVVYLLIWLVIFLILKNFINPNKIPQFISRALIIMATLLFAINVLLANNPDNIFILTRDFEIKVERSSFYMVPWF